MEIVQLVCGIFLLWCRSAVPKHFDMTPPPPPPWFSPNPHAPSACHNYQDATDRVTINFVLPQHERFPWCVSIRTNQVASVYIWRPDKWPPQKGHMSEKWRSTICFVWKVTRGTIVLKLHALMNVTGYIFQYKGSSTSGQISILNSTETIQYCAWSS
jgi:hypothetical protein